MLMSTNVPGPPPQGAVSGTGQALKSDTLPDAAGPITPGAQMLTGTVLLHFKSFYSFGKTHLLLTLSLSDIKL